MNVYFNQIDVQIIMAQGKDVVGWGVNRNMRKI